MKTVLYANSLWAFPALMKLQENKQLAGLVMPDYSSEELRSMLGFMRKAGLPYLLVKREEIKTVLPVWLKSLNAEAALVLSFPYLLPEVAFNQPHRGTFNIHFGELPRYSGAAPLFWTLKNAERYTQLTVHRVNKHFDSGAVVFQHKVPVLPGEGIGLLANRLGVICATVLPQIFSSIKASAPGELQAQIELLRKPSADDLCICWEKQSAEEVEALVNACNPYYGGGMTSFRGAPIRIHEVSPADTAETFFGSPGTIIHASSQQGLFVKCSDYKIIRINVLQTPEGIFSGNKFAALGIKSSEKFVTVEPEKSVIAHETS
ncbi:MAG: hypothetical protein MI784_01530 [Cytophagales bacterium]|nr:hypothetical protein [Cytophagales bacterium]